MSKALKLAKLAAIPATAIAATVGRTWLDRIATTLANGVQSHVKSKLTSTVTVRRNRDTAAYMILTHWIRENCEAARAAITVAAQENADGFDSFGRLHLDAGEYWFTVTHAHRRYVCHAAVESEDTDYRRRGTGYGDDVVRLTLYGDGKRRMHDFVSTMMANARVERQLITMPNQYGHSMNVSAPLRGFETIILNPNVERRIRTHLDWFKNARPVYDKRGLAYNTGILLKGPPGTGKTSICRAIANELGYCIRLGDLPHIKDQLGQMTPKSLLLIEDIDKFIGDAAVEAVAAVTTFDVDIEDPDADTSALKTLTMRERDSERKRIAEEGLQSLMQFMDGMTSMDETVIVLTTNYPERLPPELVRRGRIRLEEEIGYFELAEAQRMCYMFDLDVEETDNFLHYLPQEQWEVPVNLYAELLAREGRHAQT